ncbi:hypothetical protein Aperf_G00000114436 [Anoplocephala perfoliata]
MNLISIRSSKRHSSSVFGLQNYSSQEHESDAFTGERHSQRSPAFEKGSLIFNYAALCSQIGAGCGGESGDSLSEQTRWFVQARANLQILQESFAHAPSRDMSSELLGFLIRVMQVQAQESVFMKQMLACQQGTETTKLINYIGGAAFVLPKTNPPPPSRRVGDPLTFASALGGSEDLWPASRERLCSELSLKPSSTWGIDLSEAYGKLASGSGYDEWDQICRVIPSSWLSLLDIKSQYYQAHINYELAVMLLYLALSGRTPDAGPIEVGPLPAEGLYTDDGPLETEVGRQLNDLFNSLKPFVQLHRHGPRTRHKSLRSHRQRSRSALNSLDDHEGDNSRPRSRIKRTLSSLSFGRSKSKGLDDTASLNGRFSSLSVRSGCSSASTASLPNLVGASSDIEAEIVMPPTNRRDAHLLGQVCLTEALNWIKKAIKTIEQTPNLSREGDFKAFVEKDVALWSEQLDRIKRTNNRSDGAPAPKRRNKRLPVPMSFSRSSSSVDTASVISSSSVSSKKSSVFGKKASENATNLWTAPTFIQHEIELPKDLSTSVLKSGRNVLVDSMDPFRMLGPLKYFNARKAWSEAYTVQLVRDDKVVYGFSIQGTGPVEILGVDVNTPASENGMRTGDLVVGINGMDARFMTHNEAVAAIRFGAEGYEQAIQAQSSTEATADGDDDVGGEAAKLPVAFPPEVDVVQLTLIRPLAPVQQTSSRKQSIYLETSRTPTPSTTSTKSGKHCFPAHLRPLRKSVSSLAPDPESWFFGLSTKLRKKSSSLHSPGIKHRNG